MNPSSASETRLVSVRRRLFKWAGFGLLFAAFATGAVGLQHARLREISFYRPYIDSLMVPRKEYAKPLAFGYDMIVADFLYLRGLQAFGGQWKLAGATGEMMARFRRYFDYMTDLDPSLISAYTMGSLVLDEEGKDHLGGIALLKKGWLANPDQYRLPYLAFYTSWYSLKNDKMARIWLNRAVRASNCPEWVRREVTIVDRESGHRQAAMERWIWEYLNALDTKDEHIQFIAEMHFQQDTDEWNRDVFHKALAQYMKDHDGRAPESLEALDAAGYLKDYAACDYYRLMKMVKEATLLSGRAVDRLSAISKVVFIQRSGIVSTPFDPDPARDRYFLRRDLSGSVFADAFSALHVIVSLTYSRDFSTRLLLPTVRSGVEEFRTRNWRYPLWLGEAFPEGLTLFDPATGTWRYDPMTGRVTSPTFPQL